MSIVSNLKWLMIFIFIAMTISFAARVVINNLHAVSGAQMAELQERREQLTLENRLLEKQIAEQQSLRKIQGVAKALGFEKIKRIEYIK